MLAAAQRLLQQQQARGSSAQPSFPRCGVRRRPLLGLASVCGGLTHSLPDCRCCRCGASLWTMWWIQPTAGPALLMQTHRCGDGGMHQAQSGVLALGATACSPSMQPLTRPGSGFLSPPTLFCSLPHPCPAACRTATPPAACCQEARGNRGPAWGPRQGEVDTHKTHRGAWPSACRAACWPLGVDSAASRGVSGCNAMRQQCVITLCVCVCRAVAALSCWL